MKISKEQIITFALVLLRLCWPATAFIILCTGMIVAFDSVLLWLDDIAPQMIGWAWLALSLIYIVLGITFTLFSTHRLRRFYGSEAAPIQGRMAVLSGLPFYAIWLLFLMASVYSLSDSNVSAAGAFFSVAGFCGFALISFCYLALLFFLMGLRKKFISFVFLLIRLYWPATVFIALCTILLFVVNPDLLLSDEMSAWFTAGGWLLLLLIYIILGLAFTFLSAQWLRRLYGSQTAAIQGRMAVLSGLPFYAICLLFVLVIINWFRDPTVSPIAGIVGFLGFALISLCYLFLLLFFLGLLRRTIAFINNLKIS